jgi:excisionase family DNA binding protein
MKSMNENLTSQSGVLSEKAACQFLNISRTTLWRLRKAGRIQFYKIGSKVGYLPTQLNEFLQSCERKGQTNETL